MYCVRWICERLENTGILRRNRPIHAYIKLSTILAGHSLRTHTLESGHKHGRR
jgi:hypothetical protein